MQISKGAKLTIESKEGEWYRVYTPTGSRAYVHQDVVQLGEKTVSKRPQSVRREAAKSLVPFGKVQVAGRVDSHKVDFQKRVPKKITPKKTDSKKVDTEDLAMQKLRAAMGVK